MCIGSVKRMWYVFGRVSIASFPFELAKSQKSESLSRKSEPRLD